MSGSNANEENGGEMTSFGEKDWAKAASPRPLHLVNKCKEDKIRVFGSKQAESLEDIKGPKEESLLKDKCKGLFDHSQLAAAIEFAKAKQSRGNDTGALLGNIAAAVARCHLKSSSGKEVNVHCRLLPSLGPDIQPDQGRLLLEDDEEYEQISSQSLQPWTASNSYINNDQIQPILIPPKLKPPGFVAMKQNSEKKE